MAVAESKQKKHDHLGREDRTIHWDWKGENPIEVVLVAFILILFFMFPRTGCGIDKTQGELPGGKSAGAAQGNPSGR